MAAKYHPVLQGDLPGCCYAEGKGVPQNQQKAAALFEQVTKVELASCLIAGKGTAKNAEEGVKWYKKAFYKRNPESAYLLAECYEKGVSVPQNTRLATELREMVEPPGRE